MVIMYLGDVLPHCSSDTSSPSFVIQHFLSICSVTKLELDTVLHTRKDFAVSAGVNRIVSVRTSMIAHDGGYPLRFPKYTSSVRACVRTFLPVPHM